MSSKLLEIFEINYKMSAITRYSQTHLVNEESVLEHTGWVCMMSYFVANKLIEEGNVVGIGKLLCKAVTHDIDEIITGDIPRPTKYYNEGVTKALKAVENSNMFKISQQVELPRMYYDWYRAKENLEGNIVALCDALAVLYKVYYESVQFGNRTIIDHFIEIPQALDAIENKIIRKIGISPFLQSTVQDAKILCKIIGEQK